jgi:lipopolysaccharide transport system ATP-binding protein
MSEPVIRVDKLGKKYRIGARRGPNTLRELIRRAFAGAPQTPDAAPSRPNIFWALRDVSFNVYAGDVVGIIGRNGAGKSTLLKILSRIVAPTEGEIEIAGRIGSLLEVGTGFHPELSGRENIYLNGAILGMKRAEIARRFDEIVAFAETEKFLDTPVKYYSSGMYTRLAFAVAAHLEPEILIVDEVLAVGDAAFQKKCLGKMSQVSREGRTVLFVSHQIAAVQSLCTRAILLEHGKVTANGPVRDVVDQYVNAVGKEHGASLDQRDDRKGSGAIRATAFELRNADGEETSALQTGQAGSIVVRFRKTVPGSLKNLVVSIGIDDRLGQRVVKLDNELVGDSFPETPENGNAVEFRFSKLPLISGSYTFTWYARVDDAIADQLFNAGHFDVEAGDYYGFGKAHDSAQGQFFMDHHVAVLSDPSSN